MREGYYEMTVEGKDVGSDWRAEERRGKRLNANGERRVPFNESIT
jgi:hypothetical protein